MCIRDRSCSAAATHSRCTQHVERRSWPNAVECFEPCSAAGRPVLVERYERRFGKETIVERHQALIGVGGRVDMSASYATGPTRTGHTVVLVETGISDRRWTHCLQN